MALSLVALPAAADITLGGVPPPQPQSVTTRVYVGESVEIPLSGVSRSGAGLQFIIRRSPSDGNLSEIRKTGLNSAVVTYTHSPKAGPGMDRFRYAVSAEGIGVSTPADVIINVVERPSVFVAPGRLDFEETAVGRTSSQTLELRNDGGGRIDGRLTVPPPWKVANGKGIYSLGPGETAGITIVFGPTESRYFSGVAEFSHEPGAGVELAGRGYAPVEVVPREIRLQTDGRSEVRTGGFLVRNTSLEDRQLRIVAPPQVVVQDSLNAPAQSETQVAVHTKAGFLGALDGTITISGDGMTIETPLRVVAAPARLAVPPGTIDFGSLDSGRAGRAKIMLRNTGGAPAKLAARLPADVSISPDPAGEDLGPGAGRQYEIRLDRPVPGKFSDTVVIETDGSSVEIPISATIRRAWDSGTGRLASGNEGPKEAVYSDIPAVMQIGVTRQTRTELDLAWEKDPDASKYEIFMRTMSVDAKGQPKASYKLLDRVKVRLVRKEARATLAGLRPGESVTLVVVAVDADGVPSRPSPPLTVATKPKPPFHFPWFWIAVIVLAVLLVFIARERRRQRAELDAGFANIGRM